MGLESNLRKYLPFFFGKPNAIDRERTSLQGQGAIPCDASMLAPVDEISLSDILNLSETQMAWKKAQCKLDRFDIVDGTGGVNPGDRRAIFSLVHYFQPMSVLEVGTHIGASTLHIAAALSLCSEDSGTKRQLVSVDINDVNSAETKPWLNYGAKYSPVEMMCELNFGSFVEFVTRDSHEFLSTCSTRFDFIFLDGDHSARAVYKEVPAALKLLNPGGVILLHDYFSGLRPLWKNGSLIPGPYLAVERLCNEGAPLRILPLGELPWPTKLGSCVTSLALLLRDQ